MGVGGIAGFDDHSNESPGFAMEEEEPQLLPEAEFMLDAEGNLLELYPAQPTAGPSAMSGGLARGSESAASARVRLEHEEAQREGHDVSFVIIFLPKFYVTKI